MTTLKYRGKKNIHFYYLSQVLIYIPFRNQGSSKLPWRISCMNPSTSLDRINSLKPNLLSKFCYEFISLLIYITTVAAAGRWCIGF